MVIGSFMPCGIVEKKHAAVSIRIADCSIFVLVL
jgi:hypothetical protein